MHWTSYFFESLIEGVGRQAFSIHYVKMYVAKNDTAIKGSMPSSDCEYGSIQTFESGSTSAITKTVSTFEFAMDIVSIMSSTLSALLGVSMFAMPWGFMQSGVVGGSMILSIVAVLSFETARVLLVAQRVYFIQTDEVKGYPEIAATALGPMWHYVVQVATVISCVGGCTGYMIFFGQTLGQIFGVSEKAVLLAAALPLILLSWIRSFHDLTFFTVLGVIAMFISVIILIKDGIDTDTADTELDPITLFDSDRILNYVGPATFLFTIHYCVLSIGEEALKFKPHLFMQQAGNVNNVFNIMTSAFMAAYGLSYCIIALVGAVGFILYRHAQYVRDADGNVVGGCEDRVCQNIILNISPGIMR